MTLYELSKIAKDGNKVTRKAWATGDEWIWPIEDTLFTYWSAVADDWEIVKKKVKKTKTAKVFWLKHHGNDRIYYSSNDLDLTGNYLSELFPADTLINATFEWEEEE